MSLYEELGVSKGASQNDIKRAYRKRSQECHPDHGGNPEEFKALARAYKVLSDDDRRERYDRGEDPDDITSSPRTEEQQAQEIIAEMLAEMVAKDVDMRHRDLVDLMRKNLGKGISTFTKQAKAHREKSSRCREAIQRLSGGQEESCPIRGSLNAQVSGLDHAATQAEEQVRIGQHALQLLAAYSYRFEAKAVPTMSGIVFWPGIYDDPLSSR